MHLIITSVLSRRYNTKTGFYLNVEGSVGGDDLKQVVSQEKISDGHKLIINKKKEISVFYVNVSLSPHPLV